MPRLIEIRRRDPYIQVNTRKNSLFDRLGSGINAVEARYSGIEITNEGDNVLVRTPMPNVQPDDIKVEVQGDMLTIAAEAGSEKREEHNGWVTYRTYHGSASQRVRLPAHVHAEDAQAELDDGVLTVRLPRTESGGDGQNRTIHVKGGGQTIPVQGANPINRLVNGVRNLLSRN